MYVVYVYVSKYMYNYAVRDSFSNLNTRTFERIVSLPLLNTWQLSFVLSLLIVVATVCRRRRRFRYVIDHRLMLCSSNASAARCNYHNAMFLLILYSIARTLVAIQQRQQCRGSSRCCRCRLHFSLHIGSEQALLFFRALFLEEQTHIVDGKNYALAGRLLSIDVDAAHQH